MMRCCPGFFPDVDLTGGRYTLQDLSFSGTLCLYQGKREVRVLELGVGHSECDLVIHLPEEKIVFYGDVFMNGMMPLPGEGHITQTIANYKAIEALEADIYVAGHGAPGTVADVRAQRTLLENQFQQARKCFERGLSYDAALQALADDGIPLEFRKMIILSSYWNSPARCPRATTLPVRTT